MYIYIPIYIYIFCIYIQMMYLYTYIYIHLRSYLKSFVLEEKLDNTTIILDFRFNLDTY